MKKLLKSIISCISIIAIIAAIMPVSVFAHKSFSWGVCNVSLCDGNDEYRFLEIDDSVKLVNATSHTMTKELIIENVNKHVAKQQRTLKAVVEDNDDYYINCYKDNVCYTKDCPNSIFVGYCANSHGFPAEGLARAKGTFYQNYVYEYWRLENEIYKTVNGIDVPQIVDFFKAEDINMNEPIPLRELPCDYTGYTRGALYEVIGEPFTGDDGITHGFAEQTITPAATPTPTSVPTTPPEAVDKINEIKNSGDIENTLLVIDTDGVLTLAINGEIVEFPDLQPFIDTRGRTQIPVRALAEAFNCDVNWDSRISTAIINGNGKLITIAINSAIMTVNGVDTTMDTTAMLKDDRTCVPIRYIAEALGLTVRYEKV